MDSSLWSSSVPGILQARILKWVVISFSRGSSRPRNQTWVSYIAGRFFTDWAMRETLQKSFRSPGGWLLTTSFFFFFFFLRRSQFSVLNDYFLFCANLSPSIYIYICLSLSFTTWYCKYLSLSHITPNVSWGQKIMSLCLGHGLCRVNIQCVFLNEEMNKWYWVWSGDWKNPEFDCLGDKLLKVRM